jgi:hypothetical protein
MRGNGALRGKVPYTCKKISYNGNKNPCGGIDSSVQKKFIRKKQKNLYVYPALCRITLDYDPALCRIARDHDPTICRIVQDKNGIALDQKVKL